MFKISKNEKYLAIAILIGGKSSRFGSDKGLFEISGKPLISHLIGTLGELGYDLFLVAKSINQVNNYIKIVELPKITAFIIDEVIPKSDKVLYTPMVGLYSAFKELKKLKYKKVFALSCDNPLIEKDVLTYLIEQCESFDCCIPQWANGYLEPLFTIYPINKALLTARKNLKKKTYRLTNLIGSNWKTNFISIERQIQPLDNDLTTFLNINEPTDLEKLKEKKN